MKHTQIDENGEVRCPKCGARNSFTTKRSVKGKIALSIAAPKRLKCNGCGAMLKRGGGLVTSPDEGSAGQSAGDRHQELLAARREMRESGMSLWETQKEMHRRFGR